MIFDNSLCASSKSEKLRILRLNDKLGILIKKVCIGLREVHVVQVVKYIKTKRGPMQDP